MSKLFISYRRDDSKGSVGRFYDALIKYFYKNAIIMDIYTIESGEDFVSAVERAVGSCDTLIAVISPRWLDIRDHQNVRQITKPSDYVHVEISTALRLNIPVVPVLVDGTPMPGIKDLPDDLAALTYCYAFELSDNDFNEGIAQFVEFLGGAYGSVNVQLGETYQSLEKTRVLNHSILFEILIDGEKAGHIQGPSINLSGDRILEDPEKSCLLRMEAGTHTLSVIYHLSELDTGTMSDEVTFQIKGGQTIQFAIEREVSSPKHANITLKSQQPMLKL